MVNIACLHEQVYLAIFFALKTVNLIACIGLRGEELW